MPRILSPSGWGLIETDPAAQAASAQAANDAAAITVAPPPVQIPLVDENGFITTPWIRYERGMWERSGGAESPSGGLYPSVKTKTAAYQMTKMDGVIEANAAGGAFTIKLPTDAVTGQPFTVKKIDTSTNFVTVSGAIDGGTSYPLQFQNHAIEVRWDGSRFIL